MQADSGSFSLGASSADLITATLRINSTKFALEYPRAFTDYNRVYDADSTSFSTSGSSVDFDLGFYLAAGTESFSLGSSEASLKRAVKLVGQAGDFAVTGSSIGLIQGYYLVSSGSFSTSLSAAGFQHAAKLSGTTQSLALASNSFVARHSIEAIANAGFSFSGGQAGFKNDFINPLDKGYFTPATGRIGGSDKSSPSFLRPEKVKFNSVSKSRDLGRVDNFTGDFTGTIGASKGSQTLFFKIEILGDADLLIRRMPVNRFTDQQISVGILDSNRKSVKVNDFGFAYRNEIVNTDVEEFLDPMPKGVYYFTVSTSTWQSVPYHLSIQVIRYVSLDGSADLSASLAGRFSLVKPRGHALLSAALSGSIPVQEDISLLTGASVLTSTSQATIVKMRGAAIGRLLPTGRLKKTHRISGAATVSGANVATLSAVSPYGGY